MRQKLCRLCKEEVHVINGIRGKWCLDHLVQVTLEKQKEKKKEDEQKFKKLKEKVNGFRLWHDKTWKVFSKIVRKSVANFQGYAECYTCRTMHLWQEMHASHFLHNKLDFDRRNVKACCHKCNTYLGGNLGNYKQRLIEEHGLEYVNQLEKDAAQKTYTLPELKELHAQFKKELKFL